MICQHQNRREHTPNIQSNRQVTYNNENMITGDMHRDMTENVELPHKVDQKRNFKFQPCNFHGSTSWSDFKPHLEVCAELNCWSVIKKGVYLAVSLRGNAQTVLETCHQMTSGLTMHYDSTTVKVCTYKQNGII